MWYYHSLDDVQKTQHKNVNKQGRQKRGDQSLTPAPGTTTPATTTGPSTRTSTTTAPHPSAPAAATHLSSSAALHLPLLGSWGIVDEQSVERQGVGQDIVADVVTTDTEGVQLLRVSVFHCHLHSLQMGVHADVHTCNCPMNLCAIFQLNRHRLMTQFHKKPNKLHIA